MFTRLPKPHTTQSPTFWLLTAYAYPAKWPIEEMLLSVSLQNDLYAYLFNKSHAVCYTWLAYKMAYLKAHYPEEFMHTYFTVNDKAIEHMEWFKRNWKWFYYLHYNFRYYLQHYTQHPKTIFIKIHSRGKCSVYRLPACCIYHFTLQFRQY